MSSRSASSASWCSIRIFRATRFCVARCRNSLQEIAGGDDDEYASEAERCWADSTANYVISMSARSSSADSFHSSIASRQPAAASARKSKVLFLRAELGPPYPDQGRTMLLRILHETKLSYSEPVSETVFEVRMAPPSDEDQTNLGYRLKIMPGAPVTIYRDGFGNRVDLFNILTSYRELDHSRHVDRTDPPRDGAGVAAGRGRIQSRLAGVARVETVEYLQPSPLVNRSEEMDEFLAGLPEPGPADRCGPPCEQSRSIAVNLRRKGDDRTNAGRRSIPAGPRRLSGLRAPFHRACRGLGLPAQYVSGYIHQTGEVATHAWCQVWTGDNGWIDFDPTRATFVGDDYVKIGIGRDYSDVPPNRGVWKGRADETIAVSVKIEPIDRVPTDWSDWSAIQAPWSAASWIQSAVPRPTRQTQLADNLPTATRAAATDRKRELTLPARRNSHQSRGGPGCSGMPLARGRLAAKFVREAPL